MSVDFALSLDPAFSARLTALARRIVDEVEYMRLCGVGQDEIRNYLVGFGRSDRDARLLLRIMIATSDIQPPMPL